MEIFGCFDNRKTYLVFGTGVTGRAVVEFCKKHDLKFFIADDKKDLLKKFEIDGQKVEEEHKLYKWDKKILKTLQIDFLVLSPSVHTQKDRHKIVELAEELGVEIIADIDLFYCYLHVFNQQHGTKKQIIGITGTNGKSTTTALVAHIFNQLGESAITCGNIGVNCLVIDVEKYELFIVEMSSYNLCLMKYTKFDCGCLLNITEDHLEYHGTMEAYVKAKERVVFDSKKSVVCIDDNFCQALFNKASKQGLACVEVSKKRVIDSGLSWQNNQFYMDGQPVYKGVYKNLLGLHNVENILCAVAVAILVFSEENSNNDVMGNDANNQAQVSVDDVMRGAVEQIQQNFNETLKELSKRESVDLHIKDAEPINVESENVVKSNKNNIFMQDQNDRKEIELADIFDAVKSFEGLPHRVQFIKSVDGVKFVNDSKGTNAVSTQQALKSFSGKAIYLIAGGQRKTAGFEFLKDDLGCVKCVFLIGEATKSFAKELDELGTKYRKCVTMKKAVKMAFELAKNDLKNDNTDIDEAVVLLSPLCASWDQYKNFEERGDDFVKCVKEL